MNIKALEKTLLEAVEYRIVFFEQLNLLVGVHKNHPPEMLFENIADYVEMHGEEIDQILQRLPESEVFLDLLDEKFDNRMEDACDKFSAYCTGLTLKDTAEVRKALKRCQLAFSNALLEEMEEVIEDVISAIDEQEDD